MAPILGRQLVDAGDQELRSCAAVLLAVAGAGLGMMAAEAARWRRRLTSPARAVRRTTRQIKLGF
jgi:hypothetical protein